MNLFDRHRNFNVQHYFERGQKCNLWGRPVTDMTRDEAIAFIGYLDEHFEFLAKGEMHVRVEKAN